MLRYPCRLGSPANPLSRLLPWKIAQRKLIEELDWLPNHWEWDVPEEDTHASRRQMFVRSEALNQCEGDDGVSNECG